MKKYRILFFGTPKLSADILTFLLYQEEIEILGVVTNPDIAGGRGHTIIPSPVAQVAKEKNLPLFQPEKVRKNEEFLQKAQELQPDICIVVAYGKILPQSLLDIPPLGFLNVHTSLLPKYRGAAPIQHALLNGEKETGLTVMQMSAGMDEGDIWLQEKWSITTVDTTGSLFEKTGNRAGPLLMETLRGINDNTLISQPQNSEEATYTTMIQKSDGELKYSWNPEEAYRRWQAYTPWPGLFTFFGDIRVVLLEIEISSRIPLETWSIENNFPVIKLHNGSIVVKKVQPAGKKPMSGEDFVRGFMKG